MRCTTRNRGVRPLRSFVTEPDPPALTPARFRHVRDLALVDREVVALRAGVVVSGALGRGG